MPRVPRYGFVHTSAPTIANLGPGPNKKTILEIKIEAEKAAGVPCAELKRGHSPMDFSVAGRDGPDGYYTLPPFELWKERSYAFRLPPRVRGTDMSWTRPDLNEPQPAFVQRLAQPKPKLAMPWWYKAPAGHRAAPIQPSKGLRSSPTLPDRNFPYRSTNYEKMSVVTPPSVVAVRRVPHMPHSASAGALPKGKKVSSDAAVEQELRALRAAVREKDEVIAHLSSGASPSADSPPGASADSLPS